MSVSVQCKLQNTVTLLRISDESIVVNNSSIEYSTILSVHSKSTLLKIKQNSSEIILEFTSTNTADLVKLIINSKISQIIRVTQNEYPIITGTYINRELIPENSRCKIAYRNTESDKDAFITRIVSNQFVFSTLVALDKTCNQVYNIFNTSNWINSKNTSNEFDRIIDTEIKAQFQLNNTSRINRIGFTEVGGVRSEATLKTGSRRVAYKLDGDAFYSSNQPSLEQTSHFSPFTISIPVEPETVICCGRSPQFDKTDFQAAAEFTKLVHNSDHTDILQAANQFETDLIKMITGKYGSDAMEYVSGIVRNKNE
ncbi:hypothetical protein ECANGB1_1608 [Enterospora canceri]|uniref:Uncharacterized protein n=1 Tax=Enterospora canceri TaxID=1081671 RepID=A0A1Y1S5R1_9MICR|nr:hypothetical protein ECANGB1_1608 [Enterospora canceri]